MEAASVAEAESSTGRGQEYKHLEGSLTAWITVIVLPYRHDFMDV